MFIEVIPFGGSIDNKWLTYFVRDEIAESIRIGCLVEVPFHNAIDYAIVTNRESVDIPENPKSIVRIVTTSPLLALYQIRSIFDISSYYFVHAHQILSLFLSKTMVRYLEKKNFSALNLSPSPFEREAEWGLVSKKENTNRAIGFYHYTDNISFFSTIQKYINLPSTSLRGIESEDSGTVIVFPDDFSIEAYLRHRPIDPETTLVVPDTLTQTKKYKAFCSVYNGEKKIIIWTRRILYYNLSHYDRILYVEDSLHKSALRFGHTYKHMELLRKMAKQRDFHITIFSTLPSIESMYLLHTGVYKQIDGKILPLN